MGDVPDVLCVGVSYRTAPVELRERLSALESGWIAQLGSACTCIAEWALVTTCNRWEVYAATACPAEEALGEVQAALQAALGAPAGEYGSRLFRYTGRDAVRHLCQVAAGLDSLILGEAQVQGQIGSAYTTGVAQGTVGPVLSLLMRTAIRAGRRARHETPIGTRAVTMSSVALAVAEAYARGLADRRIVVVGAGEMARLALKVLHSRQVRQVTVVNRTLAHAQALLADPGWQALALDQLPAAVAQADIVFCATRAPGFVISPELLTHLPDAATRGKVLIDLALPRDVDPALRRRPGVILIDLDDLQEQVDQGLAARRQSIPAVESLIDAVLGEWEQAMRDLSVRPLVVELRLKAEQIRRQEMARTLRFLGDVDDSTRTQLDHLTRALVNKLLHEPTMHIKSLAHVDPAEPAQVDEQAATIRALFGLETDPCSPHDATPAV
ncbi:MAG: glutamyl-tRNA reductase [Caldilineaceae bacterium]|nr:glutamyl-tRNA reductase [Caldilineaceae bacterium]